MTQSIANAKTSWLASAQSSSAIGIKSRSHQSITSCAAKITADDGIFAAAIPSRKSLLPVQPSTLSSFLYRATTVLMPPL
jgi:hypothetical protein